CFLWIVSVVIGMKSFDHPHILTLTEKLWTTSARVMLLPLAYPLQNLTRNVAASIGAGSGYSVRSLVSVVWFLGPLALNSRLWAAAIWMAMPHLRHGLETLRGTLTGRKDHVA